MGEEGIIRVTDADRAEARESVRAASRGTTFGGIGFVLLATFVGVNISEEVFPSLSGAARALVAAAVAGVLTLPLLLGVAGMAKRRAVQTGMFAAKAAGRDCICLDGHSEAVAPTLTALA